ncbi:putative Vacuolar protein sorting-associated protein 41 like protein [Blattamonas nauphoetae]|uniref:Vacuolar protein sorting-associated protein 41 like protein n=1 Tax=Blattamonas nauphoetae TaxID=2049346 RepID=A0ABQ9YF13_9EUKA|nr:putative Vacuolar protein sorting-associated protein 41 like protein [Blattamonas nauphoetae]
MSINKEEVPSELSPELGEENEPILLYRPVSVRLLSEPNVTATAICTNPKFLTIGTSDGRAVFLDFQGNQLHTVKVSDFPINDLSCSDELFVGIATDDGSVNILKPLEKENVYQHRYSRPILTISLHPHYGQNKKEFICGGLEERLILNTKGVFRNSSKDIVSMEGEILNCRWNGRFLAWATTIGVRIYDFEKQQFIAKVSLFTPQQRALSKLYPFTLTWRNSRELFIACGNRIIVYRINDTPNEEGKTAIVLHQIDDLDFVVCGVEPFLQHMAVLCWYQPEQPNLPSDPPELRLIRLDVLPQGKVSYDDFFKAEIEASEIKIKGYETYRAKDYQLASLASTCQLFILTPKSISEAYHTELDDHIKWLLQHGKYAEALNDALLADPSDLKTISVRQIVTLYLNSLLKQQQFEQAIAIGKIHLKQDQPLFQMLIVALINANKLHLLDEIPIDEPKLEGRVYEQILRTFLVKDVDRFVKEIERIPPTHYDHNSILTLSDDILEMQKQLEEIKRRIDNKESVHDQIRLYRTITQQKRIRQDVLDNSFLVLRTELEKEKQEKESEFLGIQNLLLGRFKLMQELCPNSSPSSNPSRLGQAPSAPESGDDFSGVGDLTLAELQFIRDEIARGAFGGLPQGLSEDFLRNYSSREWKKEDESRRNEEVRHTQLFKDSIQSELRATVERKESEAAVTIVPLLFKRRDKLKQDILQFRQKVGFLQHFQVLTRLQAMTADDQKKEEEEVAKALREPPAERKTLSEMVAAAFTAFEAQPTFFSSLLGSLFPSLNALARAISKSRVILIDSASRPVDSLRVRIENRDMSLFDILEANPSLLLSALDTLPALIAMDSEKVVQLIVHSETSDEKPLFPIANVKRALPGTLATSLFLTRLFTVLFKVDPSRCLPQSDLIVQLFAQFNPSMLLPFITQTGAYTQARTLKLCEDLRFHAGTAYLLSHSGSPIRAIETYVLSLRDIGKAVRICDELKDQQFMEHLFSLCFDTTNILRMVKHGAHTTIGSELIMALEQTIDPHIFIKQIPTQKIIIPLKEILQTTLNKLRNNTSIFQTACLATENDNRELTRSLKGRHRRGIRRTEDVQCYVCRKCLVTQGRLAHMSSSLVTFDCGHSVHSECQSVLMGEYSFVGLGQEGADKNNTTPHCLICHP